MSFDPNTADPKFGSGLPPQHAQATSGGGALKWIIIILVVLLILLLGCVASCYFGASMFGSAIMQPINDMVENLNQNDEVTSKLGVPIEQVSVFEQGRFQSNITNNKAEIEITVKGPNGTAEVGGTMTKSGDKWIPTDIEVIFEDETRITITR